MNDLKVGSAAFIGSVAPATNLFLGNAEPVFRIAALVFQMAVASVTVWYILTKIRALKKK